MAARSSAPAEPDFVEEEGMARGERNRRLAIGSRVQAWRKHRGIRQGQLAKALGIPRTYLSRIENNRLLPGPMMIPKIAAALRVSVADLLPGSSANLSLATQDPVTNTILRQFLRLLPQDREEVLETVRRWVSANLTFRRAIGQQLRTQPAAERSQVLVG